MKRILVSVFDEASKIWSLPRPAIQKADALRSFVDEVKNPESFVSKHSEDFSLYEIAIHDDETGLIHAHEKPQLIDRAKNYISETNVK